MIEELNFYRDQGVPPLFSCPWLLESRSKKSSPIGELLLQEISDLGDLLLVRRDDSDVLGSNLKRGRKLRTDRSNLTNVMQENTAN